MFCFVFFKFGAFLLGTKVNYFMNNIPLNIAMGILNV
jgi:hypothetical protein